MPVSEQTHEQQTELLRHFQEAFVALGHDTRLLTRSDGLPGSLLLVGLARDAQGRDRTLNLAFLPLEDEADFSHLSLIQWYAPLPLAPVAAALVPAVARLLLGLNNQMTLGHWGLTPAGDPFLRYVQAVDKYARPEPASLQQMLLLFTHLQDSFAPLIEAVSQGEQGVDEALVTIARPGGEQG